MFRITHARLAKQIHETISDFSSSLHSLAEEAGRRLNGGPGDDSLKKELCRVTQILAVIDNDKPKKSSGRYPAVCRGCNLVRS